MTNPITENTLLNTSEVFQNDPKQFNIQLTNLYTRIANSANLKEIALYPTCEILNGQQWYDLTDTDGMRQAFRQVFTFTTISAGATLTIAHGIAAFTMITALYGAVVTAVVDYRPIPYVSATAVTAQVEIKVDTTNIYIINGSTAPNITSGFVVIEYLKN